MTRTRFTQAELNLIYEMAMIAGFGPEAQGDYQEWKRKDYRTLARLCAKLEERAAR